MQTYRKERLLGDRHSSATGWHPYATGGGGAWDGPWRTAPPALAELFQAVNVGNTATADSILRRGDVDVGMAVSGVTPLLLAAAQSYDATALSLLRAGAGHSHVAPWGTALDVARKLGGGYLPCHIQWLLGDAVAGEVAPSAP